MILTAIIFMQRNQIKDKNIRIDKLNNNIEFYQDQLNKESKQNKILQLTVDEYVSIQDSLIQDIRKIQKQINVKDKELQQAQQQHQAIKIDTTVIVNDCNFIKEIKPNNLTSLVIIKKDSLLTAKIDIRNSQTLFLTCKSKYRNEYKNWFKRLIHFDFKKKNVYEYQIHNSNPIITIENSRLVEIN